MVACAPSSIMAAQWVCTTGDVGATAEGQGVTQRLLRELPPKPTQRTEKHNRELEEQARRTFTAITYATSYLGNMSCASLIIATPLAPCLAGLDRQVFQGTEELQEQQLAAFEHTWGVLQAQLQVGCTHERSWKAPLALEAPITGSKRRS